MLMRRYIISFLMVFMACGAWAQETYYYCGGKKITLTRETGRSLKSMYVNNIGQQLKATDYLYVKLKSMDDKAMLSSVAETYGLDIYSQDEFMPLWFVLKKRSAESGNVVDIANRVYETGLFAECSPDFSMERAEISYDPNVGKQWGLYNTMTEGADINVSEAWNYATGRGVVIAIVDTGIELTHIDLAANIYPKSYDAWTGTSPSKVYGEHGTHCAGIAAAVRNNGIFVTGVAPDAKLMSVSCPLDEKNALFAVNMSRGINWAWMNGADIISLSWGCENSVMIEDAIENAISHGRGGKGCVVIKSAGNNNASGMTFPGNCRGVIDVANMTIKGVRNSRRSTGSNYGPGLFISAPGTDIYSTVPKNLYNSKSGTSMAAPHVAGVVALMLERCPDLTMQQVREILARTAKRLPTMVPQNERKDDLGVWDEYYGYGLVDAYNAVLEVMKYNITK